jgi:hypothetical protein
MCHDVARPEGRYTHCTAALRSQQLIVCFSYTRSLFSTSHLFIRVSEGESGLVDFCTSLWEGRRGGRGGRKGERVKGVFICGSIEWMINNHHTPQRASFVLRSEICDALECASHSRALESLTRMFLQLHLKGQEHRHVREGAGGCCEQWLQRKRGAKHRQAAHLNSPW